MGRRGPKKTSGGPCSTPGCDGLTSCKGLCRACYQRTRRPPAPKVITTANGETVSLREVGPTVYAGPSPTAQLWPDWRAGQGPAMDDLDFGGEFALHVKLANEGLSVRYENWCTAPIRALHFPKNRAQRLRSGNA